MCASIYLLRFVVDEKLKYDIIIKNVMWFCKDYIERRV